jgi:hypothetical protein
MSLPQPKVQMSLFDVSMLLEQLFEKADRYRIFNAGDGDRQSEKHF